MNSTGMSSSWWDLHVRRARGETLSDEEQCRYDEELARHDGETPTNRKIDELRATRAAVMALGRENANLRERVAELEAEIQAVEQTLNRETRQLLGVSE